MRHRSLMSETSELNSAFGQTGAICTNKIKIREFSPSEDEQIAINARLIAQARDHRKKALIGYDTANVMQELADS